MSLSTLIKSIQDIMRKDVGVDGDAQRISQICWLLFLKIFDDKEMEWELTISDYKSPLPEALRWSNWAKDDEGITGEELIEFVNNQLFPALKELATSANSSPRARVIGSVFADAYNYMKSGTLLRQVINVIEEDVDFNSSTDRHLFNDIYEKILADLQSAGNAGEYYTPRAVTQFIVDMIDPQLGESVLDPACGTGGFLTCAIDHLKKQETTVEDRNRLIENIHGVEKKPLPHMLAVTNMMLHDIDVPVRIRHDNTLARPFRDYGAKDRVDIIITNPPFGGVEEDGIEKNFLASHRTRETADLFMALIMHLLKPDIGRAAVVLPDGFLFGEGVKNTLKQELLENFNLHTIVRLPRGVFAPYTSINTNILFFEKGGPTTDIWFFEHPYPEGYKSYSRSKPLTIGEFDLEKAWWGGIGRKNRQVTEHAWKVSADEIIERNYNLDCKNPHQKRVEQSSPDELMSEYQNSNHNLLKAQNILKNKLLTTLTAHPVRQEMSQNNITLLKEHFDTVFSTSTGVTRLRELILILAMQGKLVEQNPSDQSANELLKDIKAEKQRLVDENKIRKQKPLPPVSEDEIPYELPESWEWVRLRDIGHDWGQKTPDNQFTYIDVGAIDNNIGKIVNPQTVEAAAAPSRARKIVHPGTIIYSTVRPYLLNIAVIEKEYAPEAIASTAFAIIHPFSGVSAQFVYRYLRSPFFVTYVESTQKGVAYPAINDGDFFSGTFPLPPLAEQLRIVAKIDELMILCDQLDTHIITCNEKQQALLNAVMSQF